VLSPPIGTTGSLNTRALKISASVGPEEKTGTSGAFTSTASCRGFTFGFTGSGRSFFRLSSGSVFSWARSTGVGVGGGGGGKAKSSCVSTSSRAISENAVE